VLEISSANWQVRRRETARREILAAAWEAAREHGLGAITLRDVATRVGMRAPSLYWHFESKMSLYDAMFQQAWTAYSEVQEALERRLPGTARDALKLTAHTYFDFCAADPARHELMSQRSIPNFTPSPQAYAPAVEVIERVRERLCRLGVVDDAGVDLYTALVEGLVGQQLANEPGGDRWKRLIDRVIDMYADEMRLPNDKDRP
jgi:AcrR family transcriptional regulator